MRKATASALLGDEAAVNRGRHGSWPVNSSRGEHPADPAWTGYVTWSEVTAHEAIAMQRSGRPHRAARLLP